MFPALALIILAVLYRLEAVWNPALSNFSPLMAMAFCSAVYFRRGWMWLVPFAALSLSDLYINLYYANPAHGGYGWTMGAALLRAGCYAAALGLGALVSRHRSWTNLCSGALGGALLFYFVTNTAAWLAEPAYAQTAAGWWQAMTVGLPQYQPTLLFFRNTLAGDLVFTALFAMAMEAVALHRGEPSLLNGKRGVVTR